jgi:hypothetical protein
MKLFLATLIMTACGRTGFKVANPDKIGQDTGPVIVYADPNLIAMEVASETACPTGGTIFISYLDSNKNGAFDSGETEKGRTTICNGATGANGSSGFGAGILVEAASNLACPAGGSAITTFVDKNNNSTQEPGETTTSYSTLCNGLAGADGRNGVDGANGRDGVDGRDGLDGANGVDGRNGVDGTNGRDGVDGSNGIDGRNGADGRDGVDGRNGVDGQSATLSASLATATQCPSGGVVYSSLSGGQSAPDVYIVCNGINGANGRDGTNGRDGVDGRNGTDGANGHDGLNGRDGTNGTNANFLMGPVGRSITGKLYTACHYDYLFFPDANGGNRGWLTFRHQKNGDADQGIGNSGHQVRNYDITTFALKSETGNRTYCNMVWNPTSRLLTYQVVDTTDGLQGTSGNIQL